MLRLPELVLVLNPLFVLSLLLKVENATAAQENQEERHHEDGEGVNTQVYQDPHECYSHDVNDMAQIFPSLLYAVPLVFKVFEYFLNRVFEVDACDAQQDFSGVQKNHGDDLDSGPVDPGVLEGPKNDLE